MDTVIFYRVVSEPEWQDIVATGVLRQGPNSVEGKHLTASVAEARLFAAKLFPSEPHRIIEVEIARSVADRLFYLGRMDVCGKAWFAEFSDLQGAIIRE